jgi:LysM repeat protein
MKKKVLTLGFFLSSLISFGQSSSFDQRARDYVKQYADWAIEEQRRVGIPASITLAQGIYETSAGESELATKANNHFGIKCKKEWTGATFAHTDDAPNECFRKYNSAKESYIDHSNYLKNAPRYAELFSLPIENYSQWAKGLKKCGYATNPAYAQKLIKMVEDFNLQEHTLKAMQPEQDIVSPNRISVRHQVQNLAEHDASMVNFKKPISITEASDKAQELIMGKGNKEDDFIQINDLKTFQGKKGEMLVDKALKYNIRYSRLLEINELADEPLPRDMPIFLEAKRLKGIHETHTVAEGETIEIIAQNEGMSSRQLRIYNLMASNEQPISGSLLKLQAQADERPATYKITKTDGKNNSKSFKLMTNEPESSNDYIPTKKPSPNVEEVEIGYGAERPSFLNTPKLDSNVMIIKVVENKMESPVDKKAATFSDSSKPVVQDEFALLKAKLDKAVYTQNSKSNIKVTSSDPISLTNTQQIDVAKNVSTPPSSTGVSEVEYHIVEKGDTGYSIAKKYGIKVKQLNEWNNLNFDGIKVGQKLRVK